MKLLNRLFIFAVCFALGVVTLTGCTAAYERPLTIEMDKLMFIGDEYELKATVHGDVAYSSITWTISDEEVAVIRNGKVVPLSEGSFNLCATVNDLKILKNFIVRERNVYSIDYELNGGNEDSANPLPKLYTEATESIAVPNPVKYGYTFVGFYDNEEMAGEVITSVCDLEENIKLYAKWSLNVYPFSYELNDGTTDVVLPVERTVEDEVFTLPTLEKENYEFVGWYDNNLFEGNAVTSLSKDNIELETLYACFKAKKYNVSYDLDGGVNGENPTTYEYGKEVTLVNPTKEHYDFAGWTLNDEVVTKIESGKTGDLTLKATWTLHKYSVTLTDGTSEVKELTINDTLPVPTKENYKFLGWYLGDTLVTSISKDCTLVAKWQALNVTVVLKHGDGKAPQTITSFADELVALFNSTGESSAVTTTKENFCDTTHPNIKFVFDDAATLAKYKWLFEFAVKEISNASAANNNTSYLSETLELLNKMIAGDVTAINGSYGNGRTIIRFWLEGLINEKKPSGRGEIYDHLTTDYSVKANLDRFYAAQDLGETVETIEVPNGSTLKTITREGYVFLGWYLNDTLVTTVTNNCTLVAKWEEYVPVAEDVLVVDPNDVNAYATIEEALNAALDNYTIILSAGTYTGFEITKPVTIKGPNAGISAVDGTRVEEAVITGDIKISANNVIIDGIKLTEKGRFVGNGAKGVKGLTISNVYIYASTVNAGSSTNGPFYFIPDTTNVYFEDITIKGVKTEAGKSRPMVLYGSDLVNLTITDSYFDCIGSSYNDAFKIETGNQFGLKGNFVFKHNTITHFQQYLLWIRSYAEGKYDIQDNVFINNGLTASSHCAVNFGTYKGTSDGVVEIIFNHNTVDNSYSLFRINSDTSATRNASNTTIKVNYNKLLNCKATYYINNASGLMIDAKNNWYDVTPVDAKFKDSVYTPFYTNESDVPAYVENDTKVEINYVLNGGLKAVTDTQFYDPEVGVETLPTPTHASMIFVGWNYNGNRVTSLPANLEGEITLVAVWREDAIYVGESTESYVYPTIAEALAVAKAGDKIILLPGTYSESFTVSVNDLTIVGPNEGVNAVTGTRKQEAVLTGKMTITGKNLKVDGLGFTTSATITGTQVVGLRFVNNNIYDTNAATKAWAETNSYTQGFIYFSSSNTALSSELVFANNKFSNVSDVNINLSYTKNISFDGNEFSNFDRDAIRFNNGGYNYGILSFTNNVFKQDTLGGNNGIYFRIYGGPGTNDLDIVIKNNQFINIGTSSSTLYSGAISARNYQEKGANIEISNNIFDHCLNYIRIRNNGKATNHESSTWKCNISDNQFLGLPTSYYFAQWNATDSDTAQNPILCEFGANYYEDNNGNVITDLSTISSLFKQVKVQGSATSTKPGAVVAEKLDFYTISYDLNGGKTYDAFVESYNSFIKDAIVLPTLTKENYSFEGWKLNDTLVTEIPATTRGNLVLVAEFKEVEGEVYALNLVTDKGNFPTRDAVNVNEIIEALITDLYEWAQSKGETMSYDAYKTSVINKLNGGTNINFRSTELGKYPAEDGSTTFFFNIPKYYNKWKDFFVIFDEAMLKVNQSQSFYRDTYAAMIRLGQFLSWSSRGQEYFGGYLTRMYVAVQVPLEVPTSYVSGKELVLPTLVHEKGLAFLGWYRNPEFTGDALTKIPATETNDLTLYAKWEDEVKPTSVTINNPEKIKIFETYQLVWEILPTNTTDKAVEFFTSDPAVLTVSSTTGILTAVGEGSAVITMKVYGDRSLDKTFTVNVYKPAHFELSYDTNSYVEVGNTISLNAIYVNEDKSVNNDLTWSSSDNTIATVDGNGQVTGLKSGSVVITVALRSNAEVKATFGVTVINATNDELVNTILAAHESNIFTRKDLGIGAGVPVYYADIYGSVSKLLFEDFALNTQYYETQAGNSKNHGSEMTSTEFITVHYTGNMNATAGAAANANYFASNSDVSIHYTTGNDGIYYVLDEKYVAYHAGDSTNVTFTWSPTGVMVQDGDPERVVFGITSDSYFTINGRKTSIVVPTGTTEATKKVTDARWINDMGLSYKVVNGEYYMGTTWWCYSQVAEGRICSKGGNLNSIGIESCVNKGSDLWYTWQRTAKLVADIMIRQNLDITRVVGHHFFSAKDCPQPLLENNLEIWEEFIELVKVEHAMMTKFKDAKVTITSSHPEIVNNKGRVVSVPEVSTAVTYTITIENNGTTNTIQLTSIIPGIYE